MVELTPSPRLSRPRAPRLGAMDVRRALLTQLQTFPSVATARIERNAMQRLQMTFSLPGPLKPVLPEVWLICGLPGRSPRIWSYNFLFGDALALGAYHHDIPIPVSKHS
eukprot:696339-Amphidinium_carterae.2